MLPLSPSLCADGNNLCIVMEYCGWGDLAMKIKRYIKRREYIDERVIWVYLIQILEGLKALHERNVLHRGTFLHVCSSICLVSWDAACPLASSLYVLNQ